jgi:hypothetical protein
MEETQDYLGLGNLSWFRRERFEQVPGCMGEQSANSTYIPDRWWALCWGLWSNSLRCKLDD